MMMIQNCADTEQMQYQFRIESEQRRAEVEQREHQFRMESEQRRVEGEHCWEEMALVCKESCKQQQLMNVMFMSMLHNNGGATATFHLAPTMMGGDNSNLPPSPNTNPNNSNNNY